MNAAGPGTSAAELKPAVTAKLPFSEYFFAYLNTFKSLSAAFSSRSYVSCLYTCIGSCPSWGATYSLLGADPHECYWLYWELDWILTLFLNFVDKPDPPRHLRVTSTGNSKISIAWDVPDTDGGSPITAYIIEVCGTMETKYRKVMVPAQVQIMLVGSIPITLHRL